MEKYMGVWKSNTLKKRKNNPHPCENCRRARKGCEGGCPCLRCKERNLPCEQNVDTNGSLLCTNCRRTHRKCNGDGTNPCTYCRKHKVDCVYVNKNKELPIQNDRFSMMGNIIAQLELHDKEILPLISIPSIDFRKLDIQAVVERKVTPLNFFLFVIMANSSKQEMGFNNSLQFAQIAEEIFDLLESKRNNEIIANACLLLGIYYFSLSDAKGFHYAKISFGLLDYPSVDRTIYGPMKGWTEINCNKLIQANNNDPEVVSDFNRLSSWEDTLPQENIKQLSPGDPILSHIIMTFGGEINCLLVQYDNDPKIAENQWFLHKINFLKKQAELVIDRFSNPTTYLAKHLLWWILAIYASTNLFDDLTKSLRAVTEAYILFKTLPPSSFTVLSLVACDQLLIEVFLRTPHWKMVDEIAERIETLVDFMPKAKLTAQKVRQRVASVGDSLSRLYPIFHRRPPKRSFEQLEPIIPIIPKELPLPNIPKQQKPCNLPRQPSNICNNLHTQPHKKLQIDPSSQLIHISFIPPSQEYSESMPQDFQGTSYFPSDISVPYPPKSYCIPSAMSDPTRTSNHHQSKIIGLIQGDDKPSSHQSVHYSNIQPEAEIDWGTLFGNDDGTWDNYWGPGLQ